MADLRELLLPHIRQLGAYQGVEPLEAMAERAGIPPENIIRLNGNENPYGASPRVAAALAEFRNFNHYPDPEQRQLRLALSSYMGVGPEQLVAGNGSDELIDLLLRIFVGPGDQVIIPSPSFGMYSVNTEFCGGEAVLVPRDANFEIDLEAVKLAVTSRTKAVLLCSPNNPSGNTVSEAEVRALLDTGRLVVVDEAYFEFCGQTAMPLLVEYPNLVALRTFSKWAGLAGLRIGLGAMHPDLAGTIMTVKPPYNVNLAAEVALIASLGDIPALLERVQSIIAERERMAGLLTAIPGVHPYPSQANFILVRLPDSSGPRIFDALCQRGIFLRHWNNPRLADCIRISVGLPEETDAVAAALSELVAAELAAGQPDAGDC